MIDRRTKQFLWFFISEHRARTLLAVVLLGVAGVLEGVGAVTLIPVLEVAEGGAQGASGPTALVVRTIQAIGLTPSLEVLLGVLFIVILLKAGFVWVAIVQVQLIRLTVVKELRLRLIRAGFRAKWRHFAVERSGAWANAISSEANAAGAAYGEACEIAGAIFPVAAYVIIASAVSWHTSLYATVSGLVLFWALRGFNAVSRRAGTDTAGYLKSLSGLTVDVIQGLKPLKAMAREEYLEPVLEDKVEELDKAQRRIIFASQSLRFFHEPSLVLLLGVGVFFLFRVSGLPLATVTVLSFIFYRILQHLNTLQLRYQTMVVGEGAFWSLMDRIREAEGAREDVHGGGASPSLERELVFDGVSFAYDERPVLDGIDLTIRAGSFTTIVGSSGSGKTTLVDLIAGIHRPSEGQIVLDGRSLNEIDLRAWRSLIGYVPQEMLLLNDTVRANVTLGDPDISDREVEDALQAAGAWTFVEAREEGLDLQVGERGAALSGGQRQRIAIARALVCRPSLLILDEVTTALDPKTEREICDSLRELKGRQTLVAISHQHALRDVADEVYVMRDGKIEANIPVS